MNLPNRALFIYTSFINRLLNLSGASLDKEGNKSKPRATIRKRISASRNKEGDIRKSRIFRKPRDRYKYAIKPKTVSKISPFPQTATVCKTEKPHQYSRKTEKPQLKTAKTANHSGIIGPLNRAVFRFQMRKAALISSLAFIHRP